MIKQLANLFERLVPIAAVISFLALLIGGINFIVTNAPSANALPYILMALLMAVITISIYGLLATIIMMHRRLKSIERKLDSK